MAITLKLRVDEEGLVVTFDDQTVMTALDKIPAIQILQADPFTNGQALTAALGGDEMLKRLADDPDNLILLDCDDAADAFAWEFATLPDRQFLCVKAGMLRTVPRTAPPVTANGALNFIALAADPLVDKGGNPREGYRLDLDNEMKAIRETLRSCGKNLEAKRIPPTREELYKALRKGSAILHLSCHGNVVPTEYGPMAMLALEKNDGSIDAFLGSELMNTKRGILRMVVLSACKTATGTEANLARALALNGVPMTVGMHGSILDRLSDDFATALYDSLFQGFTFGEALQQARQNISQSFDNVGLPVGYVSANGWSEAFPIQQGTPSVGGLGKPGESALGGEIQPPRPLLGRNLELHQIAKHFTDGGKVITVAGTGGMGKTALAASFAERFAWMWTRGVSGYSFANEVNAANFRYALMRVLFGEDGAGRGAGMSESRQREEILSAAREWNGLWLFDNYESVMDEGKSGNTDAEAIHRLVYDLANGGADMLLTSRNQPADLPNELLYPEGNHALHGLGDEAGVALFFKNSAKASAGLKNNPEENIKFALSIQRAAEGHPLAIALLAGEYNVSEVTQKDFLKNWQDELASAHRSGLAGHHVTFTIAFERSYAHLSKDLQEKLASLSIFPFPFFAEGMAVVTGELPTDDHGPQTIDDEPSWSTVHRLSSARQTLSEFTRRSLLEVDATYNDDTPATYRFQPALRQEAARRLDAFGVALKESQQNGYAAYGAWLAKRGYGDIHSDLALNRVVRLSMDAMEKATDTLHAAERLWHIRRLAWLKNAWGETRLAFDLLNSEISATLPDVETDPESAKVESSLRFELAGIYLTRGDLERALSLYQESLDLDEQLGDKKGKAASLHNMANILMQRQEWEKATEVLNEAYTLAFQIGSQEHMAFAVVKMGQVAQANDDKETALSRYHEGLALFEKIGAQPLVAQVKQLIASLEGGAVANDDPMAQVLAQAREASQRGDVGSAIQYQEQAVSLAREMNEGQTLTAQLVNLAQYYGKVERYDEAVTLFEEALKVGEESGHPQVDVIRKMLEDAKK